MEILFSFLNWAASFSHIDEESGSKMDIHNLATVITPNILYSSKKAEAGMDDSFLAIEAVHTLILCNEAMCEVRQTGNRERGSFLTCLYIRSRKIYYPYSTTRTSFHMVLT